MKPPQSPHGPITCGFLSISLLLVGCSTTSSIRSAQVSASSTAAVAANIPVCEVTTTGAVEEKLGQQVELFFYEHSNEFSWESYGCHVSSFIGQKGEVDGFQVKYRQKKAVDEVDVPALYDAHTYAEAAGLERATRFTLNGIPGEGVTIPLETGNWAAVWRYPDSTILTVLIKRNSDVEKWTARCFSDSACFVLQAAFFRSRKSLSASSGVRYPRAE